MHAEKVITRDTLCMMLSLAVCHMWQCELHAMHALVLSASSLLSFLYYCGTILLTLYSIVWDWWVLRARPGFFIGLSCCSLVFPPLFSFYGLIDMWGWGLRTDKVLIALSRPCIADLF